MKLKPGVILDGIQAPILRACAVADEVINQFCRFDATVTSVLDGKHSAESLHYKGLAVDIRSRDIPENLIPLIVNQLKIRLSHDYDVVLESTHIHIEYDKKD